MAKTREQEVFKRLRAQGLRKRTAKLVSASTDKRRKPAKEVQRTISDLKKAVETAEDHVSGGPAKRQATAKKAAATRKGNAQARSAAAKRGARTRARSQ
jgi:hypothetical protein